MKYLPPIRELIIVMAVTLYGLALAKMIERLGIGCKSVIRDTLYLAPAPISLALWL